MIIKLKHAPWMPQDWSGHPMTLILGFIFLILSALAVIISIDHPLYRNPRNPISDDRGRDQSVINSTRFLSFSWLSSLLLLLLLLLSNPSSHSHVFSFKNTPRTARPSWIGVTSGKWPSRESCTPPKATTSKGLQRENDRHWLLWAYTTQKKRPH